jgi:hypothetical protein
VADALGTVGEAVETLVGPDDRLEAFGDAIDVAERVAQPRRGEREGRSTVAVRDRREGSEPSVVCTTTRRTDGRVQDSPGWSLRPRRANRVCSERKGV